jgi:hypothetical protein
MAGTKTKTGGKKARYTPVVAEQRFGRLVAKWPVGITGTNVCWMCLCDCGKFKSVRECNLLNGETTSCRCFTADRIGLKNIKHGFFVGRTQGGVSPEAQMWSKARIRARKLGLPFDILPSDVVIPEMCPLLEIKIQVQKGTSSGNSPTLDKIIPHLGYVKGNVWVISKKANQIKTNATFLELKTFFKNMYKMEAACAV